MITRRWCLTGNQIPKDSLSRGVPTTTLRKKILETRAGRAHFHGLIFRISCVFLCSLFNNLVGCICSFFLVLFKYQFLKIQIFFCVFFFLFDTATTSVVLFCWFPTILMVSAFCWVYHLHFDGFPCTVIQIRSLFELVDTLHRITSLPFT